MLHLGSILTYLLFYLSDSDVVMTVVIEHCNLPLIVGFSNKRLLLFNWCLNHDTFTYRELKFNMLQTQYFEVNKTGPEKKERKCVTFQWEGKNLTDGFLQPGITCSGCRW